MSRLRTAVAASYRTAPSWLLHERHELARLDVPAPAALHEDVLVAAHEAHDELATFRRANGLRVRLMARIRRVDDLDRGVRHDVVQARRRRAGGLIARAALL